MILDKVTQEDKDDEGINVWEGPGIAILREPGPGLTGESANTLTREYTGTVMLLEDTGRLAFEDLWET